MAFNINDLGYEKDSKERMPWEHYMEQYQNADPLEISKRLAVPYDEETKAFTLKFLGTVYHITFPDFQVTHLEDDMGFYPLEEMIYARILTIRFLLCGAVSEEQAGIRLTVKCPGERSTCGNLTEGVSSVLLFSYGNRISAFQAIMEHLHAEPVKHGDTAYEVEIYPGYRIQMILWEGDEEFPPSSQILFSDNFPVSFQAEDMAVMGM